VAWLQDWRPGYALPTPFTAAIDGDWLAYRVELELEEGDGRVRCVGLRLEARDAGKPIGSRDLRKLRLGEWVRLATAAALRPMERTGGTLTIELGGPAYLAEPTELRTELTKGPTAKRGSTWTAYWDKGPDPETDRRRQGSKGGFRTRKEAQAHLSTVLVAVQEGTYIEPSKQLLGRFLTDEWLPAIGLGG
jgi:hypothetical protein